MTKDECGAKQGMLPLPKTFLSGRGVALGEWQEVPGSEANYYGLEDMKTYSIVSAHFLPVEKVLVRFDNGSKEGGYGLYLAGVTLEYVSRS